MILRCRVLLSLLAAFALLASASAGATTVYGDFNGTSVDFLGVQETSQAGDPEPLFGAPTVLGNQLLFSPSTFIAQANGAAGFDNTHSLLEMDIMATGPSGITEVNLTEFGDAVLAGVGTAGTSTFAQMSGFLTVTETTAGSITPVVISWSGVFSPSDSLNLVSDPGTTLWSATISIDVTAELAAAGVFDAATKATLDYNNSLFAFSEAGTAATIQKKVVDGPSVIVEVVPEPVTGALVAGGLIALGIHARRRRS